MPQSQTISQDHIYEFLDEIEQRSIEIFMKDYGLTEDTVRFMLQSNQMVKNMIHLLQEDLIHVLITKLGVRDWRSGM